MNAHHFPTGKFTYTVGEYSPSVDISEQGTMIISLEGEVIVISKYQVTGILIDVTDLEGTYAGPEYGIGRYKWNLEGETLTFTLIEDKLPPRVKAFAVPWQKAG